MLEGRLSRAFTMAGIVVTVGVSGFAACASSGTRPEDMSAEQHRVHAEQERAAAAAAAAQYNPTATRTRNIAGDPTDFQYTIEVYNPTLSYKDAAERHQREAAQHAAAAATLENFEDGQCKELPPEVRAECPLLGQIRAATDIPGGVMVTLSPGVPADAFIAHVQCHLAFAHTAGHDGMDACPLFIHGVQATAGEGRTVRFTVDAAALVPELRRRMGTHVDERP